MSLPFYNILGIKRAAPLYPKNTKPVFRFCYAGLVVDTYPSQGAIAPYANDMRCLIAGPLRSLWAINNSDNRPLPGRIVWIEINGEPLALAIQHAPGAFENIVTTNMIGKEMDKLIYALIRESERGQIGPDNICLLMDFDPLFTQEWEHDTREHFAKLGFGSGTSDAKGCCIGCGLWLDPSWKLHMTRRSQRGGYEVQRQ